MTESPKYNINPNRAKEYRWPITDSTYLVLVEVPSREKMPEFDFDRYYRNIYYVDKDRNVIWQITRKGTREEVAAEGPFLRVRKTTDGQFTTNIWQGLRFLIDLQTGFIEPIDE